MKLTIHGKLRVISNDCIIQIRGSVGSVGFVNYDHDDIDDDDNNNIMHKNNNNNQIRLGNISSSLEKPKISFSLASASAMPLSTHTDGAPDLYNAVTNKKMTFST